MSPTPTDLILFLFMLIAGVVLAVIAPIRLFYLMFPTSAKFVIPAFVLLPIAVFSRVIGEEFDGMLATVASWLSLACLAAITLSIFATIWDIYAKARNRT